ncbi:TRAP transporter substrate-binding protein [Oceanibacterium hippocampi]|nr:TRAP transporter substrate-binding protein [Oceanibacterium hippocampi]
MAAAGYLVMSGTAYAADLPKTTINVVGNLGITTQSKKLEAPFWNKEVTEKSNGAITANFRPWNEMGLKGSEVFKLLSQGVMNIATAQLGHHSGADPIIDGNDLAGLSDNFEQFHAVSDAYFPVLQKYYRENLGLHLITMQSFQDQVLYCRDDITSLKDLAGRRIRGSGASQADFVGYFGATPVDVSFGEVQPALEQGVLDCAITGTLGGYTAKWHESAKYLYTLPLNFGAGATIANAEWWDGLAPEVRDFLTTEIEALSDRMWAQNAEEDIIGTQCNTSGPCPFGDPAGMALVEPSEQDVALRREALNNAVLPGWIKRCGDICKTAFNDNLSSLTGLTIK